MSLQRFDTAFEKEYLVDCAEREAERWDQAVHLGEARAGIGEVLPDMQRVFEGLRRGRKEARQVM